MRKKQCSCKTNCGCQELPPVTAPQSVVNPAGSTSIAVRVGTHASFFESLRQRLSSHDYPQLTKLKARETTDPSIAMLDAWATAGDVLTFYNERIVNESFLRTATERRSLAELSGLIGYRPGPGVASSVYLAFTLEKDPKQASEESLIPKSTAVKSVPSDGELPQTFETKEDVVAKAEWNGIKPRQTMPQNITPKNVAQIPSIIVKGTATLLVPNDLIVFRFVESPLPTLRYVLKVKPSPEQDSTEVLLVPTDLSALKFVEAEQLLLTTFVDNLPAPHHSRVELGLIDRVQVLSGNLIPEKGVLELDALIDAEKTIGQSYDSDLGNAETILATAAAAMNLNKLMDDLKSKLSGPTGLLTIFLAGQSSLPDIDKHLKTAWETPASNGIKDDISVTEMGKRVSDAIGTPSVIGTPATGINKVIEDLAATPGDLLETVKQLLSDLKTLPPPASDTSTDRKNFREAFVKSRAAFSDLELDSKRLNSGTFTKGMFEDLAAKGVKGLNDELNKATMEPSKIVDLVRGSLESGNWLKTLHDVNPLDFRVKYGPASDQRIEVTGSGIFLRLKSIFDAITAAISELDLMVRGPHVLPLKSFTSTVLHLQQDLNGLGTKIESVAANPSSANEFVGACDACRSVSRSIERTKLGLKTLVDNTINELSSRRSIFVERVQELSDDFGDPANWDPSDTIAKKTRDELLIPMLDHAKKTSTIKAKVNLPTDSTTKSLQQVRRDLATSVYRPGDGTPYADKHRILIANLEKLLNEVSGFSLIAVDEVVADRFPGAAGLGEAIRGLADPSASRAAIANRQLNEVVKDPSDEQRRDIPDLYRQIASSLSPQLRNDLVAIWRQIRASRQAPQVYSFKTIVPLFGYNAPFTSEIPIKSDGQPTTGKVNLVERLWSEIIDNVDWMAGKEVYLSQPVQGVSAESIIVFRRPPGPDIACRVKLIKSPVQPGALNISSAGCYVQLTDGTRWHHEKKVTDTSDIRLLRQTNALVQSQELILAEVPINGSVGSNSSDSPRTKDTAEIELDGLYPDLASGQLLVFSGERSSIKSALIQELAQIKYVRHALLNSPGDSVHTRLILAQPLQHTYNRFKTVIYANVVAATNGETVRQVLGSGDASKVYQSMPLSKSPLTYLAAATPSGVESTLSVRVNNLQWHEKESLLDSVLNDRDYVVQTDEMQRSWIQFGDGTTGARLPTGRENVRAEYRVGLGTAGNVKAGTITQLAGNKPLGLKEVINPLPATGGADPENVDQIRGNAPLAVMALDRLVSVRDYADFARNYAAIEKADANRFLLNGQPTVHVTIAGADDLPIAEDSDLLANLKNAYRKLGDPTQVVQVQSRELLLIFLSANVRLLPDFEWSSVEPQIREVLYTSISFSRSELARGLYLSEVQSIIQGVEGVLFVDVDVFTSLSSDAFRDALEAPNQTNTQPSSNTGTSSQKKTLADIIQALPSERKTVIPVLPARINPATDPTRPILPAQIAYLSREVPDSLFLSEIK